MINKIRLILMILVICGAAVVSLQQLRFVERALSVFNAPSVPPVQSDQFNEGDQTKPSEIGFQSGKPGNRQPGPSSEIKTAMLRQGVLNILAYLAIWAFCIMATYYAEKFIRQIVQRKKQKDELCIPATS